MKKENNKKYEAPMAKVTCLKTQDVIMASGTLSTITEGKLMGQGKVNWVDIQ